MHACMHSLTHTQIPGIFICQTPPTFDRNSIFINNSGFTYGICISGSEHTAPHVDLAYQISRQTELPIRNNVVKL